MICCQKRINKKSINIDTDYLEINWANFSQIKLASDQFWSDANFIHFSVSL